MGTIPLQLADLIRDSLKAQVALPPMEGGCDSHPPARGGTGHPVAEPTPPATQQDPLTAMSGGGKPAKTRKPPAKPAKKKPEPEGKPKAPSSKGLLQHVRLFDAKQWQSAPRYRQNMLHKHSDPRIGQRWQAMELSGESGARAAGKDTITQLVAWGLFVIEGEARSALMDRFKTLKVRKEYEGCDMLMIIGHAWMDVAMVAKEA